MTALGPRQLDPVQIVPAAASTPSYPLTPTSNGAFSDATTTDNELGKVRTHGGDSTTSSPSTVATSVTENEAGDLEEGTSDRENRRPKGSSKTASPVRRGKTAARGGSSRSPTTARIWHMPFGRVGNGLKGSSPPVMGNNMTSNTTGTLQYAADDTDDGSFVETTSNQAAQALAKYWNDVKTQQDANTSASAGGKGKGRLHSSQQYVVVARIEKGKKIYRIRPRSRPCIHPSETSPLQGQGSASTLKIPRTHARPASLRLTRSNPNLRNSAQLSPGLASPTHLISISRDKDGFYRPAPMEPIASMADFSDLRPDSTHHLLPPSSPTSHTSTPVTLARAPPLSIHKLGTAASIPNLRHRPEEEGDVFSRLLGWNLSSALPGIPNHMNLDSAKSAHVDYIPGGATEGSKIDNSTPQADSQTSLEHLASPSLHTPLHSTFAASYSDNAPVSSLKSLGGLDRPHTITPKIIAGSPLSPFGSDVKLPSTTRARRNNGNPDIQVSLQGVIAMELGDVPVNGPEVGAVSSVDSQYPPGQVPSGLCAKALREVASSETIKTSTAFDASHPDKQASEDLSSKDVATPKATSPTEPAYDLPDTRVFDFFQSLEDGNHHRRDIDKSRLGPGIEGHGYHHRRGISATSLASATSSHSLSSMHTSEPDRAQVITVTSIPGDDPRFILWGVRNTNHTTTNASQEDRSSQHSPMGSTPPALDDMFVKGSTRSGGWRSHSSENGTNKTSPSPLSFSHKRQQPRVLMAATVERWIAEMTSKIESDLMTDFFLTYRAFLSPMDLCKLLIARFEWALLGGESASDIAGRRIVRVRTYVVIRHWLLNYFHEDFVPNRDLRLFLTAWLNRMGKDPRLRANPTDLRVVKSLKKVVKRLKAAYSTLATDASASPLPATKLSSSLEVPARSRAGTLSTCASLQAVTEEKRLQTPTSAAVEIPPIKSTTLSQSNESVSIALEEQCTAANSDLRQRTSSSEDDVDLDIEIRASGYDSDEQPRIPLVIPISPPRPRYQSPRVGTRSPQYSDKAPKALQTLPIIPDNNRLSKYLSSTVGSFGKLRKMMGTHRGTSSSEYFYRYTETKGEMGSQTHRVQDSERSSRLSGAGESGSAPLASSYELAGLGIFGEVDMTSGLESRPSGGVSRELREHTTGTSPWDDGLGQPLQHHQTHRTSSQEGTLGSPFIPRNLEPSVNIHAPAVQLDDLDSSDDESNYGGVSNVVRTIRRLPAARNLRGGPSLSYRHSFDTISSYGTHRTPSFVAEPISTPSYTTFTTRDSSDSEGRNLMALHPGIVPYFVPPVDSDGDEPGDVEAALRRLEGQVDQNRQQSNAKKVEEYLKRSEEAQSNGVVDDNHHESAESFVDDLPPGAQDDEVASQPEITDSQSDAIEYVASASQSDAPGGTLKTPTGGTANEDTMGTIPCTHTVPIIQLTSSLSPQDNERKTASRSAKPLQKKSSSMRLLFRASRTPALLKTSPAQIRQPSDALEGRSGIAPLHHSFILHFKTDDIARHLCIIERDLLEKVSWQELVSGDWKTRHDTLVEVTDWDIYMKERARINANCSEKASGRGKKMGDVQAIIQRFNLMCNWIASEIVLTTRLAERAELLAKIIRIAFASYRMYNFQVVTQLIHGLQSPDVERLSKTWKRVPAFEMRLFGQLKAFCSHLRNFKLLREASDSLAEQWGPPGQDPGDTVIQLAGIPGAIPFFGLFLRDLAIASDLPTFLDPSSPWSPATLRGDNETLQSYADPAAFNDLPPLLADLPMRPLINVHKYRSVAGVIQKVLVFKELANSYYYEPNLPLYRRCLAIRCLPAHEMRALSLACEK